MHSNMGLFTNIILDIIATVAGRLFGLLGIGVGGWIGYLVANFIGASILIGAGRMVRRSLGAAICRSRKRSR
jgi:uncharacterized membrane protein YeaQ/YmgE (transglycosylase-associated protein family)